jgi:hypothetical protein
MLAAVIVLLVIAIFAVSYWEIKSKPGRVAVWLFYCLLGLLILTLLLRFLGQINERWT